MISSKSTILSKIVEGFGGKSAILTDEASTIVEKYNNPKLKSYKIAKNIKDFKAGGKASLTKVSKELVSRPKGRKGDMSASAIESTDVKPESYKKINLKRFAEYLGVKSPEKSDINFINYNDEEYEDEYGEYELVFDDFGYSPEIMIDACDYPELNMLSGGDYVELEFKGEIMSKDYNSSEDGSESFVTELMLKKICRTE